MMSDAYPTRLMPQKDGSTAALFGPWLLKSAFQPIFDLRSGKAEIAGFEGLVRPFLSGSGASPATLFRTTQGPDRQLLETVTRDLHMMNAATLPVKNAMLFINLDPSAFSDRLAIAEALASVRKQWAKTGASPRRLVCEITEFKARSPALLFTLADTIRANGFRLAIDDYGSDESDAERLARLRPDIVKFDGRWITRLMETKPGYRHIKDMALSFAERGIATVFEGIEQLWQLELSESAGATYVQGYALARPEIAPTTFARFAEAKVQTARDALRAAALQVTIEDQPGIGYGHRAA